MKLDALICPECAQWLSPKPDDIVLACPRCFTAIILENSGLRSLSAVMHAASSSTDAAWYPFWTFQGQVQFTARETQSGDKSKDAQQFWQTARRFFIPAWNLDMWQARDLGMELLQKPPQLTILNASPESTFHSATLSREDALKLVDFIILTLEAERKDMLRKLQFKLTIDDPTLWLLPGKLTRKNWQLTL